MILVVLQVIFGKTQVMLTRLSHYEKVDFSYNTSPRPWRCSATNQTHQSASLPSLGPHPSMVHRFCLYLSYSFSLSPLPPPPRTILHMIQKSQAEAASTHPMLGISPPVARHRQSTLERVIGEKSLTHIPKWIKTILHSKVAIVRVCALLYSIEY